MMSKQVVSPLIQEHLAQWGLHQFPTESAYYAWQQAELSHNWLHQLNILSQQRQGGTHLTADIQFYDLAAHPAILPVLYSQRYGFYETIGQAVISHLQEARCVLDIGCGVGILTTLYAKWFPNAHFVGIDRSSTSVEAAQQQANRMGLHNIEFRHHSIPYDSLPGTFDTIVSTHALFQAESEPGLPSDNWTTFARRQDLQRQKETEKRTGLEERLDFLLACLLPQGQCVLVEKARHLGRRILLQRALAHRGFQIIEPPQLLSYETLGDITLDGPLYRVTQCQDNSHLMWDEEPEDKERQRLYGCCGSMVSRILEGVHNRIVKRHESLPSPLQGTIDIECGVIERYLVYGWIQASNGFQGLRIGRMSEKEHIAQEIEIAVNAAQDEQPWKTYLATFWPASHAQEDSDSIPLYENHTPSAQEVWNELPHRTVLASHTDQDTNGRQRHIEYGTSQNLTYLYWANTFDQRQLVIMESQRGVLLKQYYEESLQATD